jgi:hypothetical protein
MNITTNIAHKRPTTAPPITAEEKKNNISKKIHFISKMTTYPPKFLVGRKMECDDPPVCDS